MTATTPRPRTRRAAPKAAPPVPEAPAPPQWPAFGADAATLRDMPGVAYVFTTPAPPSPSLPVIVTDEARATWADLTAEHRRGGSGDRDDRAFSDALADAAREAVLGPLDALLAQWAAGVPRALEAAETARGALPEMSP